ncbi:TetR/AcrR family transcriptional regulator [Kytococcus sp. Marseille-QA3725]
MSSGPVTGAATRQDLTARAAIRTAALELFAESDPAAVSVRAIAGRAEVSPALVIHHFGTKAGVEQAVLDHVIEHFGELFRRTEEMVTVEDLLAGEIGGALDLLQRSVPPGSPYFAYLRRLLVSGAPEARQLVARWHAETTRILHLWQDAGQLTPTDDVELRAAQLMTHDLGLVLLGDLWEPVLGHHPLGDGLDRWQAEAVRTFSGLFADPVTAGPTTDPDTTPTTATDTGPPSADPEENA